MSAHTPLTPAVLEMVQKPSACAAYCLTTAIGLVLRSLRVGAIVLFIYSHRSAEKLFI